LAALLQGFPLSGKFENAELERTQMVEG
jgi:hypothetical protein